uniref:Cytochrome P450 n=1 Tax=Setaria italica TaxID=4555 RepID=K4A0R4_SETIT
MADLPLYLLLVSLLVAIPLFYFRRSSARGHGSALRLPPSPWALPVIGHIHHLALAGALPHRAMRDLAAPRLAVNLSEMVSAYVADASVRAIIGSRFRDRETFLTLLERRLKIMPASSLPDLFPSSRLAMFISPTPRLMMREREKMMAFIDTIIQDHRDNSAAGVDEEDLLDVLLRIHRGDELDPPLTTDNMKNVIVDIFAASSETSATTLSWIMAELMRNPRVMRKAQNEVRRVLDGEESVTEDSLGELRYLPLVIKEALRLHPPATLLIPRECRSPCQVLGFNVPAGVMVLVNADVDFKGSDFEFIPFGAGRRMCPGIGFGLANMDLALASLLYHFDWKLPDGMEPGQLDMTEALGITTRRLSHLMLVPTVRVPLRGE